MISHPYKCIFIHIPKCGGTSIEDVIWPEPRQQSDLWMGFTSPYHNPYQTGGLQHLFATHIQEEVGEQVFEDYFKFSIVRNPWDKTISQFFYMQKRPDLREFISMQENDPLEKYLELIKGRNHVQWEPQYKFIVDANGELMVDFLGRLESMSRDTELIFKRLGITATVNHVNATRHQHYSHYYTEETRAIVGEMYKDDAELLGYEFGEG